jgi:hypothetical protein
MILPIVSCVKTVNNAYFNDFILSLKLQKQEFLGLIAYHRELFKSITRLHSAPSILLIETKSRHGKVDVAGDAILVNGRPPEKKFIGQVLR